MYYRLSKYDQQEAKYVEEDVYNTILRITRVGNVAFLVAVDRPDVMPMAQPPTLLATMELKPESGERTVWVAEEDASENPIAQFVHGASSIRFIDVYRDIYAALHTPGAPGAQFMIAFNTLAVYNLKGILSLSAYSDGGHEDEESSVPTAWIDFSLLFDRLDVGK